MARLTMPEGARLLHTYAELRGYLTDFLDGRYPFLWVVGRPGVSKTESIREALRGRLSHTIKGGQVTALSFYKDCHRHRGEPIVLDDAEHLLDDKVGARLVSSLGELTPAKVLSYHTTSHALGDVPDRYYTTSPLCVIANRPTPHEDLRSRAVTLFFDPTNAEVHRDAARWFWDQVVHDFVGRHLADLEDLESRSYVHAANDRASNRDWERHLLADHGADPAACLVLDLERDATCPTREEKAAAFAARMAGRDGGSRATYFRIRTRLKEAGRLDVAPAEPIRLRHTRPPATPTIAELDAMAPVSVPRPTEEARPLDVPAREQFQQPIRGTAQPRPTLVDDSLPFDLPPEEPDEDGVP